MTYFDDVVEAAGLLKSRLGALKPRVAVVLGSGLGAVAEAVKDAVIVPYEEIPHFPRSTVEGHSGRMVAGVMGGTPVIVMQGRVHFYEGYSPLEVTFPMRVLGRMGVKTVVLTNAAGGIDSHYEIGDLVLISDHINGLGFNPLTGPNEARFGDGAGSGLRFFDMTEAYSVELRSLAQQAARSLPDGRRFRMQEGVYLATPGPSFETPAEIRAFHMMGADLVGMSTVPETIVARHMGMGVLGISCVTNLAAGMSAAKLSHEEVFEAGGRAQHQLAALLERLAPMLSTAIAGQGEASGGLERAE